MVLHTDRLTLLPLTFHDLDWFHATNINSFVRKHIWDDKAIDRDLAESILRQNEQLFEQSNWGLWKIIHTVNKQPLGYAGLWVFFEEPQPQLLYALLPDHTGKGIATEASRKIIEYAFEALAFSYLIAATDEMNADSVVVCKRLGMKLIAEKDMDGKPTLFFRLPIL